MYRNEIQSELPAKKRIFEYEEIIIIGVVTISEQPSSSQENNLDNPYIPYVNAGIQQNQVQFSSGL